MGLTEQEADFLESLTGSGSTRPPSLPLKNKKPYARPTSHSLGLNVKSYKISSNLTGPPSPSVSGEAGSSSDSGTNLASSLWPQKGESTQSFLLSTPSSEPQPNSEANGEEARRLYLPPISSSRKHGPSESLPSLIPRLSRLSLPTSPAPSTPSSPATPSKEACSGTSPFLPRPLAVNEGEFGSRPSDAPSCQNRKKDNGTLWTAIQDAGVPIFLGTPGFDGESMSLCRHENMSTIIYAVFALCPSALGTYCSPTALLTAFSDIEVFYHVYAAGQKLSREDLWVSQIILSNCRDLSAILQDSVQRRL